MAEQQVVKIVGLEIIKKFGALKATELTFDENNNLTVIKGEVGAGKTQFQKALELTTKGRKSLEDSNLYGEVELTSKLIDGNNEIWVGCKTNKANDGLEYYLYTKDENGKKIKEPVIDGKKATPAAYLSSLQTSLTWRIDELTSQNPTTQKNLLLELYAKEMQDKGVIFDKNHPNYVGSVIDLIEKAKQKRSIADMKRKEVGGIADDLTKKGIKFDVKLEVRDLTKEDQEISNLKASINLDKQSPETTKTNNLNAIKLRGSEANTKLRNKNDELIQLNIPIQKEWDDYNKSVERQSELLIEIESGLKQLFNCVDAEIESSPYRKVSEITESIKAFTPPIDKPTNQLNKLLTFSPEGRFSGKIDDYEDLTVKELIQSYLNIVNEYITAEKTPAEVVDVAEKEKRLLELEKTLSNLKIKNEQAKAVNSFLYWQECNNEVNGHKKDYFNKLVEINTGVSGLSIAPEFVVGADGEKIAKDDADIYLYYNGEYDPAYFANPNKEIRKVSSYSGTQKPVICLLIQEYLLKSKPKAMRYLWIDDVPMDNKSIALLSKMATDMDLHLFVNWTGDFDAETLEQGEILIQGGELILPIQE